jgi:amidohydrolase
MLDTFAAEAAAIQHWVVTHRRALHRRPELSNQERDTQAYILAALEELGIPCQTYPGFTAVVGLIQGDRPGPTVALRADMDALPLHEEATDLPFCSQNPGVMHACGHDAHMAIQLGAARLLAARRDDMPGAVKLLFEHAEETTGGAKDMIAQGCLENPRVDAVLGLHITTKHPTGVFCTRPGVHSGSSDDIQITVRGRPSHGAYPQRGVDALVMSAQVITALQTVVSRNTSPLDSAVLSLGIIHGGAAPNIICEEVRMEGTLRTLLPEVRQSCRDRIQTIVPQICAALGGEGFVALRDSYGPLVCDEAMTLRAMDLARQALGPAHVVLADTPSLGVESFGFFTQRCPGVYYDVGCGIGPALHTRDFRVHEDCLRTGVQMQATLAWDILHTL